MKIYAIISLVLIISFIQLSCNNPTSPPTPPEITGSVVLKVLDVSCTEAFLKVTALRSVLPVKVTLRKDDSTYINFPLSNTDTVLVDTSLQPGETYKYQSVINIDSREEKSDTVQARTLNVTSDNYTWKKYYLGNGIGFHDCAIVSENDIWCVGMINVYDSSSSDYKSYNAAHWDGTKWELKQTYFPTVCGQAHLTAYESNTLFAPGDGQVWMSSSGDKLAILKDGDQVDKFCLPSSVSMTIRKIWGASSNDFYLVGLEGGIAHYYNSTWQKIPSNTDWGIYDIYGDKNPFTNQTEIICGSSTGFNSYGSELIRINNDETTHKLDPTGLGEDCTHPWFKAGIRYYVVGDGLYEKTYKDTTKWINLNQNLRITSFYMDRIAGNGLNDIVVVGAFGNFLHFNGLAWHNLTSQTALSYGAYYALAVKGNLVVAAGYESNQGVILIGRHL